MSPVQVKGPGGVGTLTGPGAVELGQKHSCTVKSDSTMWCWGLNNEGQLGDNSTTDTTSPVQVKGAGGVGTITDAAVGAAGDEFTCAIRASGTAWCWGKNADGQLGDGTTSDSSAPAQVL